MILQESAGPQTANGGAEVKRTSAIASVEEAARDGRSGQGPALLPSAPQLWSIGQASEPLSCHLTNPSRAHGGIDMIVGCSSPGLNLTSLGECPLEVPDVVEPGFQDRPQAAPRDVCQINREVVAENVWQPQP